MSLLRVSFHVSLPLSCDWVNTRLGFRYLGRCVLAVVERFIEGAAGVQLGVGAGGDDAALIEDEDHRGIADGAEAVRDDEHGFTDNELF